MKFIILFFHSARVFPFLLILLLLSGGKLSAQTRPFLRSGTEALDKKTNADSARLKASADSVKKLKADTVKARNVSGLDSTVNYSAEDSVIFDHERKLVYLYGKARVSYNDLELGSDFMLLDQEKHTIFARGSIDPKTKKYRGRPIIKQGAEAPAYTDSLFYDFETRRAKLYRISTEVEGGYLQAQQSKKNEYDEISIKNGKYSTCNLPDPHFYIAITKGIVTDKQIVTGPAYLVIEDVTFPAIIPFGFFPKVNKRASGVLFPTFGEEATRGFYMRDLGYYIGLTDYWDAEIRGTLYSKGSYEGSLAARYRKNYKYDGNIMLNYASTRLGVEGTPEYAPKKNFSIQWSHSMRNEANPGTSFSASVNVQSSSYNSVTAAGGSYNIQAIANNALRSNVSYAKQLGSLFNMTASLQHSQDIETKQVQLELPAVTLAMSSFNPFDSKNRTGEQKWFQKINVGYNMQAKNSISAREDQLFKKEALSRFVNGMQHSFNTGFSQNVLKYFQFNIGVPYRESWTLQTIRKNYVAQSDTVLIDTVRGFSRAYDYNFTTGLSTKVYGQFHFKKGKITDIRHTMTPSVSLFFQPDFGKDKYGFYRDLRDGQNNLRQRYSIFEQAVFGAPGAGKQGSINFTLDNTIEGKRRSNSDTTNAVEKFPILQGLSFNTSYNMAADSFRLANIGFSGRTALFKQKLGINFSGTFDPYVLNERGFRVNEYAFRNGKLARLVFMGFGFDYSFNSAAAKSRANNANQANNANRNISPDQAQQLSQISTDPNAFVDFNVPWNINLSYTFNYSKPAFVSNVTNTFSFSGDFSVTPKWKVTYNSGYDFYAKKISITQFAIYRDLHCWDMAINWVPFGTYRSYSIDLKVKAAILQDLKLSRRRPYY
ncbi:putative LPS assembly protein LptD [Hufsiella ginkgonis]|uniref:LPS-assembly protein LptD n=1 Tax=Hufsiella ginkgonis TaxID=2695274 RepID=A0A7K1XWA8_9SPHI|nr:putative LPS assembly protein LptD [Hufsiella ginkgonis]MXV15260.1 LPS-assembly protein LptD [Hufsiella ginkgonis]